MATTDSPAAEIEIDPVLVRSLLHSQHPELADLPLTFVAEGWDNTLFRLGEELLVRLPRRAAGAPLMENELRWLPHVADKLPLPIPVARYRGEPDPSFPWSWSVVDWVEGADAIERPLHDTERAGVTLGSFFRALHQPAPADAPVNPSRGTPLAERDQRILETMDELRRAGLLPAEAEKVWRDGVAACPHEGPPVWLHGDPHAGNVVVRDDQVVSVIDWGDITSGDPASDLTCMWVLLDPKGRAAARAELPYNDDTWRRGRSWALSIGTMLLARSNDRPAYFALGQRTVEQALIEV